MIHAEKKTQTHKANHPKKNGFAGLNRGEVFCQEQQPLPLSPMKTLVETHPRGWNKPGLYSEHEDISPWQSIKWWNFRLRGPFYVLMSIVVFMGFENGFPNHGLREEGRYIRVPTPTPSKSDHQDYYVTTCFLRKSCKPSFVTLTGKGSVPRKEMASDVSACMKRSNKVTSNHVHSGIL